MFCCALHLLVVSLSSFGDSAVDIIGVAATGSASGGVGNLSDIRNNKVIGLLYSGL